MICVKIQTNNLKSRLAPLLFFLMMQYLLSNRGGEFLLGVKIGIPHNHGKRYDKQNKSFKLFGILLLIVIIVLTSIILLNKVQGNNSKTKTEENIVNTVYIENVIAEQPEPIVQEPIGADLPDQMGGYKIIGEIVIDKIGARNNIIYKTNNTTLDLSITKFWGVDINHIGNISLTGHNYEGKWKRLHELNIGDTFYLINKEEQTKVTYEIFDTYTCSPYDVSCLDPVTSGQREVTLITCNPGGLTRLIYKAKEISCKTRICKRQSIYFCKFSKN